MNHHLVINSVFESRVSDGDSGSGKAVTSHSSI